MKFNRKGQWILALAALLWANMVGAYSFLSCEEVCIDSSCCDCCQIDGMEDSCCGGETEENHEHDSEKSCPCSLKQSDHTKDKAQESKQKKEAQETLKHQYHASDTIYWVDTQIQTPNTTVFPPPKLLTTQYCVMRN